MAASLYLTWTSSSCSTLRYTQDCQAPTIPISPAPNIQDWGIKAVLSSGYALNPVSNVLAIGRKIRFEFPGN